MDSIEKSLVDAALRTVERFLLDGTASAATRQAADELNVLATGGAPDGGLPTLAQPQVDQLLSSSIYDCDGRARKPANSTLLLGHAARFAEHHLKSIALMAGSDRWDWRLWDGGLAEAGYRPEPPDSVLDATDALRCALALTVRAASDSTPGGHDHAVLQRAIPLLAEQVTLSRWA